MRYIEFADQYEFSISNFPHIASQPDALRVLWGHFVPVHQKSDFEFLARMGQHRALTARLIGTMWRGEPSTVLVVTMLERAVEPIIKVKGVYQTRSRLPPLIESAIKLGEQYGKSYFR
jgi:hypothetical protein